MHKYIDFTRLNGEFDYNTPVIINNSNVLERIATPQPKHEIDYMRTKERGRSTKPNRLIPNADLIEEERFKNYGQRVDVSMSKIEDTLKRKKFKMPILDRNGAPQLPLIEREYSWEEITSDPNLLMFRMNVLYDILSGNADPYGIRGIGTTVNDIRRELIALNKYYSSTVTRSVVAPLPGAAPAPLPGAIPAAVPAGVPGGPPPPLLSGFTPPSTPTPPPPATRVAVTSKKISDHNKRMNNMTIDHITSSLNNDTLYVTYSGIYYLDPDSTLYDYIDMFLKGRISMEHIKKMVEDLINTYGDKFIKFSLFLSIINDYASDPLGYTFSSDKHPIGIKDEDDVKEPEINMDPSKPVAVKKTIDDLLASEDIDLKKPGITGGDGEYIYTAEYYKRLSLKEKKRFRRLLMVVMNRTDSKGFRKRNGDLLKIDTIRKAISEGKKALVLNPKTGSAILESISK